MYEKRTLPNGVRILLEPMDSIRSAALGIWVASGSQEEKASENGAAHFIEHMVFKGSQTETAAQLAGRMDAIGGQVNAFTTKECTCFYAHALDSHLHQALDILCTLLFDAKFDQKDVETERGVILEEIGMYRDAPDDLVSERLMKAIYKGSSLGRPILGTPATLGKMDGAWLRSYKQAHYGPEKIVISLVGSFGDDLVQEIEERFSVLAPQPSCTVKPAVYQPAITLKKKSTEQNHLLMAFPSITVNDPKRYGMQLLSTVLGGGMSSRLFQEVREKKGLCYSISSYGVCHRHTGIFCIYTALNREMEGQALSTICDCVKRFVQEGITEAELHRAREQSKANVLMGLESTSARMNYLARCELFQPATLSPDEIIAAYDAVTLDAVRALAEETFRFDAASLSAVGKTSDEDFYRSALG